MCDQMCSLRSEILTKTQCVQGNFVLKRQVLYALTVNIDRICFISFEGGVLNELRPNLPDIMLLLHLFNFSKKGLISCPFSAKFQLRPFKPKKYLLILSLRGKFNFEPTEQLRKHNIPLSCPSILS